MNAIAAAVLFVLTPFVAAPLGGDACQVAASAVPTPGLPELVMGSKERAVPDAARLTEAQIRSLARQDTQVRRALEEVEARFHKLPAGKGQAAQASLADKPLPEQVAHFLAGASREQAFLIDVATDEKSHACTLCPAVRRGMEAKFQWRSGELAKLTPEQEQEAANLAARREELRRKWAAAVQAELNPVQLAWLREAQMRWLEQSLRTFGAKQAAACTEASAAKCVFGAILTGAVAGAKS